MSSQPTSSATTSRRSTAASARSTRPRTSSAPATSLWKTGPWIFGKRVILPAMVVDRVDHDSRTVYVSRTKDEIKNAPEYDDESVESDAYRSHLTDYYGPGGAGYREPR